MLSEIGFVSLNIDELCESPWDPHKDTPRDNTIGSYLTELRARQSIVALQEVTGNALTLIAQCFPAQDYEYVWTYRGLGGAGYDPDGTGCLMVVPKAIATVTRYVSEVIEFNEDGWYPAVIQQVWIETVLKEKIRLIHVHGTTTSQPDGKGAGDPYSERFRTSMFTTLTEIVREESTPTLVLGDLNVSPDTPSLNKFVEATGAVDVLTFFEKNGTRTAATKRRADNMGWSFQPWADQVFWVSPDEDMGRFSVKVRVPRSMEGSDHYPIEISLRAFVGLLVQLDVSATFPWELSQVSADD